MEQQLHQIGRGVIGLSAILYIGMRAAFVPMTYDEATSFVNYVNAPLLDIFDFSIAANHWLNSVLTRLSSAVFGDAPWALRLPNVLAGAVYVLCCATLGRYAPTDTIRTASLVIMVSNLYLLDYFALSRGYGLSASLMFASYLVLSRWWPDPLGQPRLLLGALALAALATVANLGSLIGYVAAALIALGRIAAVSWRATGEGTAVDHGAVRPPSLLPRGRLLILWATVSVVVAGEVFSRAQILDANHRAVTEVEIAGLAAAEAATASVYQLDATGRPRQMRPSGTHSWSAIDGRNVQSIRVVLPRASALNIDTIAVSAGATRYVSRVDPPGDWLIDDVGDVRDLRIATRLRWSAPTQQRIAAYGYAAGLVGGLGVTWVVLAFLVRRVPGLAPTAAPALTSVLAVTFWLVPFAAAPLYLLRRDGQLFHGGMAGVFDDTIGSLIAGSMYHAVPAELTWRVGLVAAGLMLWCGVSVANHLWGRRRQAGSFVAVLLVATVLILYVVLHRVLGIPYPLGRTALILLPLLLSMPLSVATLVAHGRYRARIATACMVALATICAWQFGRFANVRSTFDWPHDMVAAEVVQLVAKHSEFRAAPTRLGVDWQFYPPLAYYAQADPEARTKLRVVVAAGEPLPLDYAYVHRASDEHLPQLIQLYPESEAELTTTPVSSLSMVR